MGDAEGIKVIRRFSVILFVVTALLNTFIPAGAQNPVEVQIPDFPERTLAPLYESGEVADITYLDVAPFWVSTEHQSADAGEQNILYPLITRNRFGNESRLQILQFISFTTTDQDPSKPESPDTPKGLTLFPVFFSKQASSTTDGYWALVPFYGELDNRLFKKHIKFVMFPLYAETEKKDFKTWNYLYPVFHVRRGESLHGWGVWPLAGSETRDVREIINSWNDPEVVDGYSKGFAAWPFISWESRQNEEGTFHRDVAVLPVARVLRSEDRDSTTVMWPLLTYTDDRKQEYRELGFPWPFIVFARGEGKTLNRVWPFYSYGEKGSVSSGFLLWPFFLRRTTDADPLFRQRDRILFFLYSDTRTRNSDTGEESRRQAFWPLFRSYRDAQGYREFQTLALLEPLFQVDEELRRTYGPLWTLYKSRTSEDESRRQWSTFLNLAHGEKAPEEKSWKFAYGLLSHRSTPEKKVWKFLSLPVWKKSTPQESGNGDMTRH